MEQLILSSISGKTLLKLKYGGLERVCEPHVFGYCNGIPQLLCYQVEGKSKEDRLPEWRRFDLSAIQGMKSTKKTFPGARVVPHPHSLGWDQIIAVVS